MSSTVTYIPMCHCFACINGGKQVTATKQVVKQDRTYRVCDVHADVVERAASIEDALRVIRRQRTQGGAA